MAKINVKSTSYLTLAFFAFGTALEQALPQITAAYPALKWLPAFLCFTVALWRAFLYGMPVEGTRPKSEV